MRTALEKKLGRKDKGFTLIELLVVIVIIGILAAIAIPIFLKQREKAHDAGMEADLKNVATAVETYYVDQNHFPAADAADVTAVAGLDAKVTTGNVVSYDIAADGKSYCLKVTNAEGTDPGVKWYDSDGGGLVDACVIVN